MKKNAAEQIFMDVISEVPSIKRNGITHSNEFYEAVLNDANLSNEERVEVLINTRQKAKEKIKELERQHCKTAHMVAEFEFNNAVLRKAISKRQRGNYRYHIFSTSTTISVFAMTIIFICSELVPLFRDKHILIISIIAACLLSLLLTKLTISKSMSFAGTEVEFMKELGTSQRKLSALQADILSLERLVAMVDGTLRLNDADDFDDLK